MNVKHQSVGRYISVLYRRAQAYIGSQMKSYDIGSGQYSFLIILYEKDGISQEELAAQLLIDKGTTARAVDKLEKAGYVVRKKNPEDRRAYNIFLTDKANEIKPILFRLLGSWTDILIQDLSEQERELLYIVLEKMVKSTVLHTKSNK